MIDAELKSALEGLSKLEKQVHALERVKIIESEIAQAESNIHSLMRAQHHLLSMHEERSAASSHNASDASSPSSPDEPSAPSRFRSKTTTEGLTGATGSKSHQGHLHGKTAGDAASIASAASSVRVRANTAIAAPSGGSSSTNTSAGSTSSLGSVGGSAVAGAMQNSPDGTTGFPGSGGSKRSPKRTPIPFMTALNSAPGNQVGTAGVSEPSTPNGMKPAPSPPFLQQSASQTSLTSNVSLGASFSSQASFPASLDPGANCAPSSSLATSASLQSAGSLGTGTISGKGTTGRRSKFTSAILTMVRRKSTDAVTWESEAGSNSMAAPPLPGASGQSPGPGAGSSQSPPLQFQRRLMALRAAELAESSRLNSLKADKLDLVRRYLPDMATMLLNEPVSPTPTTSVQSIIQAAATAIVTGGPLPTFSLGATGSVGGGIANGPINAATNGEGFAAADAAMDRKSRKLSTALGGRTMSLRKRFARSISRAAGGGASGSAPNLHQNTNSVVSVSSVSGGSGANQLSLSMNQLADPGGNDKDGSGSIRSVSTSSSLTNLSTGSVPAAAAAATASQPSLSSPVSSSWLPPLPMQHSNAALREANATMLRNRIAQTDQTRREAARRVADLAVQCKAPGSEMVAGAIHRLAESQRGLQSATKRMDSLERKKLKLDLLLRDLNGHLRAEEDDVLPSNVRDSAVGNLGGASRIMSMLASGGLAGRRARSLRALLSANGGNEQGSEDQIDGSSGAGASLNSSPASPRGYPGPGSKAMFEARRRLRNATLEMQASGHADMHGQDGAHGLEHSQQKADDCDQPPSQNATVNAGNSSSRPGAEPPSPPVSAGNPAPVNPSQPTTSNAGAGYVVSTTRIASIAEYPPFSFTTTRHAYQLGSSPSNAPPLAALGQGVGSSLAPGSFGTSPSSGSSLGGGGGGGGSSSHLEPTAMNAAVTGGSAGSLGAPPRGTPGLASTSPGQAPSSLAGSTYVRKSWYDLASSKEGLIPALPAATSMTMLTTTGSGTVAPSGVNKSLDSIASSSRAADENAEAEEAARMDEHVAAILEQAGDDEDAEGEPSATGDRNQGQPAMQEDLDEVLVPVEEMMAGEAPWFVSAHEIFSRSGAMLRTVKHHLPSANGELHVVTSPHTLNDPSSQYFDAQQRASLISGGMSQGGADHAEDDEDPLHQQVCAVAEANDYYLAVLQEAARQRHELRVRMAAGIIQLRDSIVQTIAEMDAELRRLSYLVSHLESEAGRLAGELFHAEQELVASLVQQHPIPLNIPAPPALKSILPLGSGERSPA